MGTPSAVSSHRVEGALSPKYHIRANVVLRGHRADRIAPRNPTLSPGIFSKRVKHNRTVECGHPQGINSVALILLQRNVKHKRNIGCGHSQEYNVGTPSAVSSHRVAGALSPKYHARANVALRGHCADRIAVNWS